MAQPVPGQLNDFLSGHGLGAMAARGPGVGFAYAPTASYGTRTATLGGIGTPSAGGGYTYSWNVANTGITW